MGGAGVWRRHRVAGTGGRILLVLIRIGRRLLNGANERRNRTLALAV